MAPKKLFVAGCKIAISCIIAFILLTLFCYFYYNMPVHNTNSDGSTDYKWEENTFYSRGTEGFAWGKTNNDGFMNMFDYEDGMEIDILIMGSSQMEAYQVGMDESTASRLNLLLGKYLVYNIGISAHNFLTCACNLEAAVKKYQPAKYIIIETDRLSFSEGALAHAINGTMAELPSYSDGIVGFLQHNQFLRLLYKQAKDFMKAQTDDAIDLADNGTSNGTENSSENMRLLNQLLEKMSGIAEKNGANIIIVYHPGTIINYDGTLHLTGDSNISQRFQKLCENNGIIFLDMSCRFKREYYDTFTLPYGFANSPVGSGHLNKYGHNMIADELYNLISEVE